MDTLTEMVKKGGGAKGPQRPQRPRPNPKDVYAVNIDGAPFKGAKDAKVTVVKAFEFAWPFCQKVGPTLDTLLKDYKGDIKVVYKHFVVHPGSATEPALAACAADKQGKFEGMYDDIWTKAFAKRDFKPENMEKIAKELGLDVAKFKADKNGECKKIIAKDQAELRAVGTSGTPAFYINGRFLSGARPVEQFKVLVDEELKKANAAIGKDGLTAANYYQKSILAKGKKKL